MVSIPSTRETHDADVTPATQGEGGGGTALSDPPIVRVRGLEKRFQREDGSVVNAIDGVTLDVHKGDFIVLLGPSGCGKTTLLRTIAGLERPDAGRIEIGGRPMYSSADRIDLPPERRPLSMIFQSYALWPHMTAFQNVAYPLLTTREGRRDKQGVAERVHRVLSMVGVPELAKQYPSQMSGGQQQRIALARALVGGDQLILFDEPLSNVDAKVRDQLRLELISMQRDIGFSALFVTHDQVEAMELASSIAVMREGQVEQFASPRDVYDRPRSRYVANFIGSANELVGRVRSTGEELPDGEGTTVDVETDMGVVRGCTGTSGLAPGDEVVAIWRPERMQLVSQEPEMPNRWEAVVKAALFVGSHTELVLDVDGHTLRVWSANLDRHAEGGRTWVVIDPADVRVLPAESGTGEEQRA